MSEEQEYEEQEERVGVVTRGMTGKTGVEDEMGMEDVGKEEEDEDEEDVNGVDEDVDVGGE